MMKPFTQIGALLRSLRLQVENPYYEARGTQAQTDTLCATTCSERELTEEAEPNPRFVWIIGSISESFPDIPELAEHLGGLVLWDRQEKKPVVTLHRDYEQIIVLETTRSIKDQPLTNLENWLNGMQAGTLSSEGISDTCPYFHP